jgi:hypothetical protein
MVYALLVALALAPQGAAAQPNRYLGCVTPKATVERPTFKLRRGVMYPIIFDRNPIDSVERVLELVVRTRALNASPEQYAAAVDAALQSDEPLARLLPQSHSEAVIRTYLTDRVRM